MYGLDSTSISTIAPKEETRIAASIANLERVTSPSILNPDYFDNLLDRIDKYRNQGDALNNLPTEDPTTEPPFQLLADDIHAKLFAFVEKIPLGICIIDLPSLGQYKIERLNEETNDMAITEIYRYDNLARTQKDIYPFRYRHNSGLHYPGEAYNYDHNLHLKLSRSEKGYDIIGRLWGKHLLSPIPSEINDAIEKYGFLFALNDLLPLMCESLNPDPGSPAPTHKGPTVLTYNPLTKKRERVSIEEKFRQQGDLRPNWPTGIADEQYLRNAGRSTNGGLLAHFAREIHNPGTLGPLRGINATDSMNKAKTIRVLPDHEE